MTHKLINTGYYLYIIDPEETSEVDKITFVKDGDTKPKVWYYNNNKILAHLPLNNSPIFVDIDLLPPLEDDVEQLVESMLPKKGTPHRQWVKMGVIEGYNKAKEKYKWTNEDVIKIVEKSRETGLTAEYLIQSLQQPKMPVRFECEMEDVKTLKNRAGGVTYFGKPKTTTNSQGLTQWVGKYIYG